jgi:hypothetical protein
MVTVAGAAMVAGSGDAGPISDVPEEHRNSRRRKLSHHPWGVGLPYPRKSNKLVRGILACIWKAACNWVLPCVRVMAAAVMSASTF